MMRRLAMLMLNLYPLAFRRRYGDEMRALLEEMPATKPTTPLNLVRGALAAHLRPQRCLDGLVDTSDRLRASTSGVLACWVIFAAAGVGFYKTTEDRRFSAAGDTHALLGGAHVAVQALAVIASCAVVIGAIPLIFAALGEARRERRVRVLVSLPIMAVAVFAVLTGGMVWLAQRRSGQPPTTAENGALIAWTLAGCACAAICVVASRKALFAVPVAPGWLRSALACGTLITGAMVAIALAVALYTIALLFDASQLAASANGPGFVSSSAWLSLTVQVIVMAASASLALMATLRGWRALGPTRA